MSSKTTSKRNGSARSGLCEIGNKPAKRSPAFAYNTNSIQSLGCDDEIIKAIFAAVHDKSKWYEVLEAIVERHGLISAYFLHRERQSKAVIIEVEFPKPQNQIEIQAERTEFRKRLIDRLGKYQIGRFQNLGSHSENTLMERETGSEAHYPAHKGSCIAGYHLSCPVNELYVWVESSGTKGPLDEVELDQLSSYVPLFKGALKQLAKTEQEYWKKQCLCHVLDDLGAAVYLVDGAGKVQHTNKLARYYIETGVINSGEAMAFKNQNDSERYGAGLKALFENDLFERVWEDIFVVEDDAGQKHTVKISPYFCDGNWRSPIRLRSHIMTIRPLET